jgi:hypothetical protein
MNPGYLGLKKWKGIKYGYGLAVSISSMLFPYYLQTHRIGTAGFQGTESS